MVLLVRIGILCIVGSDGLSLVSFMLPINDVLNGDSVMLLVRVGF